VSWCLQQYRVKPVRSFVSRDGRHAVCIYEAPDAEAVRATQREAGLPFERIWAAELFDPPIRQRPEGYSPVLVQRELPMQVSIGAALGMYEQTLDCNRNHRVLLWHSYLSTDGSRMICRYHAPDAESVRIANRESEMPVEAIWSALEYGDVAS
jgi:hypothetical protein